MCILFKSCKDLFILFITFYLFSVYKSIVDSKKTVSYQLSRIYFFLMISNKTMFNFVMRLNCTAGQSINRDLHLCSKLKMRL